MKVENGKFYFIKDEFFDLFKNYKLMENKENGNKRPCFFCFNDPENEEIIWFVPISSKVDKYKKIYEIKKENRKKVYNFIFGKLLGKERVFLIQNIFPTCEKYVENKYQNKMQDVEITENLKNEIIETSMSVIKLARKGFNIPFYDIMEMKQLLLENIIENKNLVGIKNSILISMDEKQEKIQENIDIIIENDKILKIGMNIIKDYSCDKVIDATGKVVMPGLINAHAHVPMSVFRETVDGYKTQDWLEKKIWPMESKLEKIPNAIYHASLLTFAEMIKTGCTTINDMYFETEQIITAMQKAGIRLQTSRTLMGNSSDDLYRLKELEDIMKKYKGVQNLTFNAGIHGFYTTSKQIVEKYAEFARKNNLNVHIHFCENAKEVEDIEKSRGKMPVKVLKEELRGLKLILAHSVKLNDDDIDELSKIENISIVSCPVSNLKLGCGVAPIYKMISKNINVSLGTDGQGSGSNVDMFETMKFASLLQKGVDENPEEITSFDALKMATINGAKALGLENEIGSIEEGKKADIIIVNINNIIAKPTNDLLSQLVYNIKGIDVETTIVNGKILMEDRKLINLNEKEIVQNAEKIIKELE